MATREAGLVFFVCGARRRVSISGQYPARAESFQKEVRQHRLKICGKCYRRLKKKLNSSQFTIFNVCDVRQRTKNQQNVRVFPFVRACVECYSSLQIMEWQ